MLKSSHTQIKGIIVLFLTFYTTSTSAASLADSVYISKYDKVIYYDSDSIYLKYAKLGFAESVDDLYTFYADIVPYLSPEKQSREVAKMRVTSKEFNSRGLGHEADFLEVILLPTSTDAQFKDKVLTLESVVEKAGKDNNEMMKLRAMEALFDLYLANAKYARAFHEAYLLDKALQDVSDEKYPSRRNVYFRMGEAYYYFKDYDKAIPCLQKALKPSAYFFDNSNIQARNIMGSYHNVKGNADSALYYFRSSYFCIDNVRDKSRHEAIALGNIGECLIARGEYDSAMAYLSPSLCHLVEQHEYSLAANIIIGMGKCYLAEGKLKESKAMIDSSRACIEKSNNPDLYISLYPLLSKYYGRIKETALSEAYIDSTIMANMEYEKKYSSISILRAEQKAFESETKAKDEEVRLQKNRLFFSIGFIGLILASLIVFIYLYRQKKMAYQLLVLKSQDWAKTTTSYLVKEEISETEKETEKEEYECSEEEHALVKRVEVYILKDKLFSDLDLTLDLLAKSLDVNRNFLSKAINRVTGKNFNAYVNEYRIKEAIKIMSDKKSDVISIDAIALEVGFSNRISFYQSFKKITGLSPSMFRSNRSA